MRYNLLHKVFGASEVFSFVDGFFLALYGETSYNETGEALINSATPS